MKIGNNNLIEFEEEMEGRGREIDILGTPEIGRGGKNYINEKWNPNSLIKIYEKE